MSTALGVNVLTFGKVLLSAGPRGVVERWAREKTVDKILVSSLS